MTKRDHFLAKMEKLANIGLITGAVLSLLVFFHYFYYYEWTKQRQFGSSFDLLWISCIFPLGLASFLLAALRFKPVRKVNLVILFVTVAASVYGAELFFELSLASTKSVMTLLADSNDKQKDAAELSEKFGGVIDTRPAGEVIASLRKKGVDAVPIVTSRYDLFTKEPDGSIKSALKIDGREVIPLASVSNKVTVFCNENGQWLDYRSDEHGFNNSNEIWHSGRLEIAALGDSFAQGYCVPVDKNFVALIRQRYPATLNLGFSSVGPLLELATLKEYLPPLKPKIVLWFYFEGNDLEDLQFERKSDLLRNYLKDGFTQSELARQSDIDRAIMDDLPRQSVIERTKRARRQENSAHQVIDKLGSFAKLAALRQRLGLVGGVTAEDAATLADLKGPNMEIFRDILSQTKARVEGWGGQLYFVYLPEWARFTDNTSWGKTNRNGVLTLVSNLGIPIVDIAPVFQAYGDPLSLFPFRANNHYNETGHRLVAEEVVKVISPTLDRYGNVSSGFVKTSVDSFRRACLYGRSNAEQSGPRMNFDALRFFTSGSC